MKTENPNKKRSIKKENAKNANQTIKNNRLILFHRYLMLRAHAHVIFLFFFFIFLLLSYAVVSWIFPPKNILNEFAMRLKRDVHSWTFWSHVLFWVFTMWHCLALYCILRTYIYIARPHHNTLASMYVPFLVARNFDVTAFLRKKKIM